MKSYLIMSLIALSSLSSQAMATVADDIKVEQAYVRAVPPNQPISAAFMVIENTDMNDHQLRAASSPAAQVVELHTHTQENGMMKMRQVPEINLPAGAQAILKPGGLHIMLINLTAPLSTDHKVPLTLQFEDGSQKQLELPVQPVMMQH